MTGPERIHDSAGAPNAPPGRASWRPSPEPTGSRLDDWWQRQSYGVQRAVSRGVPAAIVGIAALTRLAGLGHPGSLVFDETFYVKDAWTLANLGFEASWPAGSDPLFNAGQTDGYKTDPSFVVHPPLGKWLIALGMMAFGPANPVGWRIATAIVGILAVVLLMLVAKRLLGSTVLSSVAGLLMAIDGNAIVMSRVALLDNFVMFFALLGFGAVLLDRDHSRARLEGWLTQREQNDRSTDWGPALWWRPWLLAAGIAFGAASAVKWSGLYFLAAFAIYSLVVDAVARRRAGIPLWISGTVLKQTIPTFLIMVPVAIGVYLTTWTGWFITSGGYARQWASEGSNAWTGPFAWVPHTLQSLWHFEVAVYNYHLGENRPHPYQANPLTWLLLIRPTSMYYRGFGAGDSGCVSNCGESITGIANPVIWWAATAATLFLVYRFVRQREWRVGLILTGVAAGYLPWLLYSNRTVFQFYTIAFEPYLLLALTFVIGLILGSAGDARWRRVSGLRTVSIFLALAVVVSIYFWPLWSGTRIDYELLASHWWLPTWH